MLFSFLFFYFFYQLIYNYYRSPILILGTDLFVNTGQFINNFYASDNLLGLCRVIVDVD